MSAQWTSPNHGDRKGHDVSMAVLHYTGMRSAKEALERLCDPEAQVSAHYVIEEDGTAHQLVQEDRRAWHAGVSCWRGEDDVNSASIGFELVNPGHEWGYREFPAPQIEQLMILLRKVIDEHRIKLTHVVGHSDVAPGRKEDPGELFPWAQLAKDNLAIGPWSGAPTDALITPQQARQHLQMIGYDVDRFGLEASTQAFQRRFAPSQLGKGLDAPTSAALSEIAKVFGSWG